MVVLCDLYTVKLKRLEGGRKWIFIIKISLVTRSRAPSRRRDLAKCGLLLWSLFDIWL